MASIHQLLCLFFVFYSNFQRVSSAGDLKQNATNNADHLPVGGGMQSQVQRVAGEDENGETGMLVLEKLRVLLGFKRPNIKQRTRNGHWKEELSLAPAPSEAHTPPVPSLSTSLNTHVPSSNLTSIPPTPNSIFQSTGKTKGTLVGRTIIIVVYALAGVAIFIVVLLVIMRCQRRRRSQQEKSKFAIPSNPINKVTFDPGPEFCYLQSLGLFLDDVSCVQGTCESMGAASKENHFNSLLLDMGESNSSSSTDDNICPQESFSSLDESLHSGWDSHSSNARFSNASEGHLSDLYTISPSPNCYCNDVSFPSPVESLNPSINPPPSPVSTPENQFPAAAISSSLNSSPYSSSKQNQQASSPSSHTPPPCPPLPPIPPPSILTGVSSIQPSRLPPIQDRQFAKAIKDSTPLPRLKPLHWDKIGVAIDRSMIWDQLRSSSFKFDEEKIESLFGYDMQRSIRNEEFKSKSPSPSMHALEPKRLQNITILSKALNATVEQICAAVMKGDGLYLEQLETLIRMVPTKEEEEMLSDYHGDFNELDPAEKLIHKMLKIPFAFQRIEAMFYKDTFEEEVIHIRKSFAMLEEACNQLSSCRMFLKLLEIVLKTGNRINVGTNRGGARAFKLDVLLKLADVKGTDGKTTLLHFIVQEMIRSEGEIVKQNEELQIRSFNLVSSINTELCNVKKASTIDLDILANSISNLADGLLKLHHLVVEDLSLEDENENFVQSMKSFLSHAEKSIKELREDKDRVLRYVREITEYFHGNVSKEERHPLQIFFIVSDFLGMLDSVWKDFKSQ